MEDFDYIICGGGAAGLGLAYHIFHSEILKDKTVLILDKEDKIINDRTWCYWTDTPMPLLEPMVSHQWSKFGFYTPDACREIEIKPYQYQLIRGIDYYSHIKQLLATDKRFKFVKAEIQSIESTTQGAVVTASGKHYSCRYVFSSLFAKPSEEQLHNHIFLLQHFVGYEVKSEKALFNPSLPIFMDFRVQQRNHPTFMYVLPFSAHQALVEYTLFSPELLSPETYDLEIREYLEKYYQLSNFEITYTEKGAIPMTDYSFPAGDGKSVIYIGSAAGMSKATSGYTFYRIQKHSANLVSALENKKNPASANIQSSWKLKMDRLMLYVMLHEGDSIWSIFQKLFDNNPSERVLAFLNEESSYMEDLMIMASVPSAPFVRAIFQSGIKL